MSSVNISEKSLSLKKFNELNNDLKNVEDKFHKM